jgi:hypothetical protein
VRHAYSNCTAGAPSTVATASNYQEYVNPQWVTLLNLPGMNVENERCIGCELFTKDGRRILDFLSSHRALYETFHHVHRGSARNGPPGRQHLNRQKVARHCKRFVQMK